MKKMNQNELQDELILLPEGSIRLIEAMLIELVETYITTIRGEAVGFSLIIEKEKSKKPKKGQSED